MSHPDSARTHSDESDQLTLVSTTSFSLGITFARPRSKVQVQRVELPSSLLCMLEVQEQRA
jgi:hypothetical protein